MKKLTPLSNEGNVTVIWETTEYITRVGNLLKDKKKIQSRDMRKRLRLRFECLTFPSNWTIQEYPNFIACQKLIGQLTTIAE